MTVFARQVQDSQRNLAYGWPFLSIFGDHYRPPDTKKGHLFEEKHKNAMARLGMPRFYHVNSIQNQWRDVKEAPEPMMMGVLGKRNATAQGKRNRCCHV